MSDDLQLPETPFSRPLAAVDVPEDGLELAIAAERRSARRSRRGRWSACAEPPRGEAAGDARGARRAARHRRARRRSAPDLRGDARRVRHARRRADRDCFRARGSAAGARSSPGSAPSRAKTVIKTACHAAGARRSPRSRKSRGRAISPISTRTARSARRRANRSRRDRRRISRARARPLSAQAGRAIRRARGGDAGGGGAGGSDQIASPFAAPARRARQGGRKLGRSASSAGIALALAPRKWQFVNRWRLGPAASPVRVERSPRTEERADHSGSASPRLSRDRRPRGTEQCRPRGHS